jgi:non-ribosomal peptide synthetase component F
MAERAAKRRIAREIGFDLVKGWRAQIIDLEEKDGEELVSAMLEALERFLEPTEGDLDLETLAIHERSTRLISAHAKTQVEAAKALDWAKTQRELLLPILNELSLRFATLIRKWVGRHSPGDVTQAIDELGTIIRRTVGELAETREKT